MRVHIKIEFPCGYKYELDAQTALLEVWNQKNNIPEVCPLHGRVCKQQNNWREVR